MAYWVSTLAAWLFYSLPLALERTLTTEYGYENEDETIES